MDYQLLFIVFFLILFVSFESIDKKHKYTESEINKTFNIENFQPSNCKTNNPNFSFKTNSIPFLHCPEKSLQFVEHQYPNPNIILSKQPGRVRQCRLLY